MPLHPAPLWLLAAALLSGCVPGGGYFAERGYFPDRYGATGYYPARALAPAAMPLPLTAERPFETAPAEAPARATYVDERVPQPWPAGATPETPTTVAALLPERVVPAADEPLAPIPAAARRSRRAETPARADGPAAGGPRWRAPVLQPKTPEVGTPEWEREKAQTERRERDLNRTLRGICSGC